MGIEEIVRKRGDLSSFYSLGEAFVQKVELVWQAMLESLQPITQKQKKFLVAYFLKHLQRLKLDGQFPHFFTKLAGEYQTISTVTWELVQSDYHAYLESRKDLKNKTKNVRVLTVRQLLSALAREGVIPHLSWLATFPCDGYRTLGLKGLADPNVIRERLIRKHIECSAHESKGLLDMYELLVTATSQDDPSDQIPQLILALMNDRLRRIRAACESAFLQGLKQLKAGQSAIAASDISPEQLDQLLTDEDYRNDFVFPRDERGLSRLLAYVRWKWGYIPSDAETVSKRRILSGMRYLGYTSQVELDAYINPSIVTLAAAASIVMIDTAANPYPVYELSRRDSLYSDPSHPGFRWVMWYKWRAGGRLHRKLLPEQDPRHKISAVTVLAKTIEYTEHLSQVAHASQGGYVFLTARGPARLALVIDATVDGPVRRLIPETFAVHFKRLIEKDDDLRDAGITPGMLRSYTLLKVALETRSIFKVQEAGQHESIKTSWGYVYKIPSHLQHEALIRDFLETLQVLFTHDKPNLQRELKIDGEIYQQRLANLHRTGFGIDCIDPTSGIQPDTKQGELCHRMDNCLTCRNSRRQIQADAQTLADILMWQRHLESELPRMSRENPERWEAVWLPWLVFCEVVLEKARSQIPLRASLTRARFIVANTNRSYPPLW